MHAIRLSLKADTHAEARGAKGGVERAPDTCLSAGAADWYISHYALSAANLRIPHNPESWLARLAQLKQVPVQERPLCKLPFVSVRFVHNASALGVVVKRRHYQAARDDDRCWATRNGSGGWSRCSDAESMRSTLETMRICPKHPCGTR